MEGLRRNAVCYLQDSRLSDRELNPVPPVYAVILRLTKIIRSEITFVSRNVISRKFP